MLKEKNRREARQRRHQRVRKKVYGTPERPRLAVFRSLSHIYAQLIDDTVGKTVASASTVDPEVRSQKDERNKTDQARVVGASIAEKAKSIGITSVVFDRGGYLYHGRVKALAEGAREAKLEF